GPRAVTCERWGARREGWPSPVEGSGLENRQGRKPSGVRISPPPLSQRQSLSLLAAGGENLHERFPLGFPLDGGPLSRQRAPARDRLRRPRRPASEHP